MTVRMKDIKLGAAIYYFDVRGKSYAVTFQANEKRWLVGPTHSHTTYTVPWNGVHFPPRADCAETVLAEHLGIED